MNSDKNFLESTDFLEYLSSIKSSGFLHHEPSVTHNLMVRLFQNDSELDFDALDEVIAKAGYRSANDIKNFKFTLIGMCNILCHRIALYQLDFELVYHMADYLTIKIDQASTFQELKELGSAMLYTFQKWYQANTQKKYSYLINRCVQYVYQNLHSSLTLSEVSNYMNLTPQYLSSQFKKETGETFLTFVHRKKIAEAKMLLEFSALSISEVSETLGYNSVSHFSNAFKNITGTSPSQYRSMHRFS